MTIQFQTIENNKRIKKTLSLKVVYMITNYIIHM